MCFSKLDLFLPSPALEEAAKRFQELKAQRESKEALEMERNSRKPPPYKVIKVSADKLSSDCAEVVQEVRVQDISTALIDREEAVQEGMVQDISRYVIPGTKEE